MSPRHPVEEHDDVGDQVDVSSLAVLGRPERAAGEARADAYDRLLEIDIAPAEREQLSLPHPRLEGDQAQCPERLGPKVREEPGKLFVLEVGSLFPLGTWTLCRW